MNKAALEARRKRSRESMRKRRENPEYRAKEKEYDKIYRQNNRDKERQRQVRYYKRLAEGVDI
ncbi:hypothetical protein [Bacillus cereus]|uniref:Uncharacterized protein n=1 Tax=Bacillus cereus TaxID=1396 RepID=A0A9X6VLL8_BACCE|nr:hypothetical protein [Bacillus cereus]PFC15090.1 hypothetical protein CN284_00230 [Bacillus cereus]PFD22663.1 hypothetical protein CN263_09115 [Bacillus cereus]